MTREPVVAVPTLDEIAADPSLLDSLPRATVRSIYLKAATLTATCLARLVEPDTPITAPPTDSDRLLTVVEACTRLNVQASWLYRNSSKLPFVRKLGTQLRVSERALERYLRNRA